MTAAVFLLAAALAAPAPKTIASGPDDWPQWRGPNRDGKSTATKLLKEWPDGGPKLAWKKSDIGAGYGQTAVVGDRMYLVGADGNKAGDSEFIACLSMKDGKELWKKPLGTSPGKFLDGWGGGPRGTPTVDGEFVFVLGATGDLVAFRSTDGGRLWAKNLVKDFGGGIPQWGYSESPLIDGDKIIVTPGGKGGMVALNKKTGEPVWTCKEFGDGAGYSSIVIAEVGGLRQYVQQTMASAIGVSATDGKLLWKTGEIGRRVAVIPTPVLSDDYVFLTAGYGAGNECYKLLSSSSSTTTAEKVYSKHKRLANHHGGVIAIGDYVYGHSDAGGWTCLAFKEDKDEAAWQYDKFPKGSITFADGFFYCYSERDGELVRIKASPEKWDEAGRMKLPETSTKRPKSGKVWPHPVIAQGKLILRDYDLLFVYDIR